MTGTKKGTCYDEHGVKCRSAESLYHTPETNVTLYVNSLELKFKKLRCDRKDKKAVATGTTGLEKGILTHWFCLPILFCF